MHENFINLKTYNKQTNSKIISNNNMGKRRGKKQITLSTLWSWEGDSIYIGTKAMQKNLKIFRLKQQSSKPSTRTRLYAHGTQGEMTGKISEAGRGTLALSEQMDSTSFGDECSG